MGWLRGNQSAQEVAFVDSFQAESMPRIGDLQDYSGADLMLCFKCECTWQRRCCADSLHAGVSLRGLLPFSLLAF